MKKSTIILGGIIALLAIAIVYELSKKTYGIMSKSPEQVNRAEYPVDTSNVQSIRRQLERNINSKLIENSIMLNTDGNVKIVDGYKLTDSKTFEKIDMGIKHYSAFNIFDIDTVYYKEQITIKDTKIEPDFFEDLDDGVNRTKIIKDTTIQRYVVFEGSITKKGENTNTLFLKVTGDSNVKGIYKFLVIEFKQLIHDWKKWREYQNSKI